MKIAVYGGSFNPPHICHQMVILYVLETKDVDEVWLMPCFDHAFDKKLALFDFRLELCEALAEPFGSKCSITEIEKELDKESRTIDSMAELEARHPEHQFLLIMGSDLRSEAHKWKKFDELVSKYQVIWIGRQNNNIADGDSLILPDVSSSDIREKLNKNKDVSNLIPDRVLEIIKKSDYIF